MKAARQRAGARVACNPVERDRRWPAREGAAGMWLGSADGWTPIEQRLQGRPRALPGSRPACSADSQAAWAAMGRTAMLGWVDARQGPAGWAAHRLQSGRAGMAGRTHVMGLGVRLAGSLRASRIVGSSPIICAKYLYL